MKILVLIKMIPAQVGLHAPSVQRDRGEQLANPADLNALETAIQIRDSLGGTVTVLCMGPLRAERVLREAVSRGADHMVLVSDTAFSGSDSYCTAGILSRAVQKLGGFDLILCGAKAADSETGHVGPQLSALLDIPCVTHCVSVKCQGDSVLAVRTCERFETTIQAPLPALLTVRCGMNTPRLPTLRGLRAAREAQLKIISAGELDLLPDQVGQAGSPTRILQTCLQMGQRRSGRRVMLDDPELNSILREKERAAGGGERK